MKVSLLDFDRKTRKPFPNLALLKLAAWHRAKGDDVDWYQPLFSKPDLIYCSKVFSFSGHNFPKEKCPIHIGGTGFNHSIGWHDSISCFESLPKEIEHTCPDYSMLNLDYSMGFITRGCIRKCDFCIVPKKEGKIRFNAHIEEFQRHKKVLLLDNNILACEEGINELYKIAKTDTRIDINQCLDFRLMDKQLAKLLSELKWIDGTIRTACDSDYVFDTIKIAVKMLEAKGVKPSRIVCYCLVKSKNDIPRILELDKIGVRPFAMGYMDLNALENPTREVRDICRWVNKRSVFMVCKDFSRYKRTISPPETARQPEGKGFLW